MYKAVHFNKANPGLVRLDNYDGITVKVYSERTSDLKGRVAYFPLDSNTESPEALINKKDKSNICYPKTGKTLYVCSESKVPRAILRNSDYKITINRENADFVVIPYQASEEISSREQNITLVVEKNDFTHIYYFELELSYRRNADSVDAALIEQIKKKILERIEVEEGATATFYFIGNLQKSKIYFVRKCQELEEILTDEITDSETKRLKFNPLLDINLKIDAINEINLEMLQIWSKMDDRIMLCKHIINSDWQKYPCTIAAFVEDRNLQWSGGEQMKYVLRSIDFEYYRYNNTFKPNQEIQPDDWNLLQDWIMLKNGLGSDGGFKVCRASDGVEHLVRRAICVKPYKISEPTLYQEIEAKLKN